MTAFWCNIMMGLWCVGTTIHLLAHMLHEVAMKLGWNTTRMWGGVYVFRVNTRCHNIPLVSLIKMLKFWRLFVTINISLKLLMLRLFNYFNTKSERWVMWLILKMFEMFISQGWSSHISSRSRVGGFLTGGLASGSGCCAGHLRGTSSGWGLQNNCRFPWSVQWYASCGYSWLWFGCCWSNWCSGWGCWCRSHWEHPRWGLWCSWGYTCADRHVWLDSIWMTFMDVIMCMSVLASANDLNHVGPMSGLMNDCGWEPEGLGIIEYRDSLPYI